MSAFQRLAAPNPAGLDPSALEQIYAQGASRKLGPGMLLNLGLVEGSRERDRQNLYLENLGKVNSQAMQAGQMELEHNANMELLKQGVDAIIKDPRLVGTALGQGATARGAWGAGGGGGGTLNPQVLQEIFNTGVGQKRADLLKTAGEGADKMRQAGKDPNTVALSNLSQIPLTDTTPTSAIAAAAGRPDQLTTKLTGTGDVEMTLRQQAPGESAEAYSAYLAERGIAATRARDAMVNRNTSLPAEHQGRAMQIERVNPGSKVIGVGTDAAGKPVLKVRRPSGAVIDVPATPSPPAR